MEVKPTTSVKRTLTPSWCDPCTRRPSWRALTMCFGSIEYSSVSFLFLCSSSSHSERLAAEMSCSIISVTSFPVMGSEMHVNATSYHVLSDSDFWSSRLMDASCSRASTWIMSERISGRVSAYVSSSSFMLLIPHSGPSARFAAGGASPIAPAGDMSACKAPIDPNRPHSSSSSSSSSSCASSCACAHTSCGSSFSYRCLAVKFAVRISPEVRSQRRSDSRTQSSWSAARRAASSCAEHARRTVASCAGPSPAAGCPVISTTVREGASWPSASPRRCRGRNVQSSSTLPSMGPTLMRILSTVCRSCTSDSRSTSPCSVVLCASQITFSMLVGRAELCPLNQSRAAAFAHTTLNPTPFEGSSTATVVFTSLKSRSDSKVCGSSERTGGSKATIPSTARTRSPPSR
mmetsp:Transcript_38915/g.91395  ORF Transcript_38915/g.91395 Transcript_38915/m.91395 type:complete len:404 (+) Transcript_38915:876-2087(+)